MALIAHYIEHRRQREEQVIAALAEGLQTVEAIADRIYVNLAPALVPMARESVLAHLVKLEGEGRARVPGTHWVLAR